MPLYNPNENKITRGHVSSGRRRVGDTSILYEPVILKKYCKVKGCDNYMYRPKRGQFRVRIGMCVTHRLLYYRNWYHNHFVPAFNKWPEEKKRRFRAMSKKVWDAWVARNINRRRSQALKSYHKHKERTNWFRRARHRARKEAINARRRARYAQKKGHI